MHRRGQKPGLQPNPPSQLLPSPRRGGDAKQERQNAQGLPTPRQG
jgi:hypothetical protein